MDPGASGTRARGPGPGQRVTPGSWKEHCLPTQFLTRGEGHGAGPGPVLREPTARERQGDQVTAGLQVGGCQLQLGPGSVIVPSRQTRPSGNCLGHFSPTSWPPQLWTGAWCGGVQNLFQGALGPAQGGPSKASHSSSSWSLAWPGPCYPEETSCLALADIFSLHSSATQLVQEEQYTTPFSLLREHVVPVFPTVPGI